MSGKAFFDTNVLVYAFTAADPRSNDAINLLAAGGIISIQVLNEFVNVSRKKYHRRWSEIGQALQIVQTLLDPPLPLTADIHADALKLAQKYRFEFYDSLIVAAALGAGCGTLYTEDLQHGQKIDGLTVRNPFKAP